MSEMKWLPIESAPKDGTQILVFIPFVVTPAARQKTRTFAHHPQMRSAFWAHCVPNPMHEPKARAKFLQEQNGGYWAHDRKGRTPLHAMPTHWMPLPPPPSKEHSD